MRKNFKKIIAGFLSMALVLSMTMTIKAEEKGVDFFDKIQEQQNYYLNTDNVINELGQDVYDEMLKQPEALEAYNYLLNTKLQDSNGNVQYPDDYAGEYIENGKLIILSIIKKRIIFTSSI